MQHLVTFLICAYSGGSDHVVSDDYHALRNKPEHSELFRRLDDVSAPGYVDSIPYLQKERAKLIWKTRTKVLLPQVARDQIHDIHKILQQPDRYVWSRPIGGIIQREPDWIQAADASLFAGGGICERYQFWFRVEWPHEIQLCTVLHRLHPDISINDLEFAVAIISVAAGCLAWSQDASDARLPHPCVQQDIDNVSGKAWLTKPCMTSQRAKRLTSILCSVLLQFPTVTVVPRYINTKLNVIPDDLSRVDTPPDFLSLSSFFRKHPQVRSFRRYQPSRELLSDIFCALLQPQNPGITHRRPLGHFVPASRIG